MEWPGVWRSVTSVGDHYGGDVRCKEVGRRVKSCRRLRLLSPRYLLADVIRADRTQVAVSGAGPVVLQRHGWRLRYVTVKKS